MLGSSTRLLSCPPLFLPLVQLRTAMRIKSEATVAAGERGLVSEPTQCNVDMKTSKDESQAGASQSAQDPPVSNLV